MPDYKKADLASKLIKTKEDQSTGRGNTENVWQQISEFVLPNRGDFTFERAKGTRADHRVFDTTAVQANEMLAAAIYGGLINPASTWFNLTPGPAFGDLNYEQRLWLDTAMFRMMRIFQSPEGNFYQQAHEFLLDLVAYGTAVMYVDENVSEGISFNTRHLSEIYIREDNRSVIDMVTRCFKFTPRQAAQEWGEEKLGKKLREELVQNPHKEYSFLHVVMPRKDAERLDPSALEGIAKNRKFISFYVCEEDKCILDVSGFYENPYIVARWEKLVGETYGRSPAWNSLSDIRMINVMSEVIIRAAQKQVDPPLLVSDDGVIMPLQTRPSGINVGGISMDGRPLIQPLQTGGSLNIGLEMLEQRRDAIRQAYFVDQFVPKQGTPISATEAAQNQENRLRLTGPQLTRVETEFLAKIIDRVFAIGLRSGEFGEVPESLENVDLNIEYTSPLAKNQRAQELVALNRAIESASIMLESNPTLLEVVDGEEYFRNSLEIAGVPARTLRSRDEFGEIVEQRAEQAAQEQQLQQAEQLSGTAANLSKAGVIE